LKVQNEYFLIEALDSAFDRDARATSHPLFFEIQKAEDVSEAFDSITYSKGASVLRMISAVMGEANFRRGLNIYLNRSGEGVGDPSGPGSPPLSFPGTSTGTRSTRTCGTR
jgi:aminopeptidase N